MHQQFTVSRDEAIYESFPDVALADGTLVCVFAECTHHGDRSYTRIVYARSTDRGRTWSEKRPLTEPLYRADESEPFWNCPRVSALADGRLVAVVDRVAGTPPDRDGESLLWVSDDRGESWSGPRETPVTGIVPDQPVELTRGDRAGRWVFGAHDVERDGDDERWVQRSWHTDDEGETWHGPHVVASEPGLKLCEGSTLELPDGRLVCFMRENSGEGRDCFKSVSEDGGETWSDPVRFPLPACHRPVAGLLASGRVLVTHRFMQGGAGWTGWWTQNTFAGLTDVESCLADERDGAHARIVPLDHDRSARADTGYTGWVQFDDGEVYVVNYVVDDAPARPVREPEGYEGEYDDVPKAYVRGYAVDEADLVIGDVG